MIGRSVILVAVLLTVWLLVGMWERRRGTPVQGVAPGVTMFTTDDCRICPLAIESLTNAGVPVQIVSANDPLADALSVRSVPTVVVADTTGQVTLRRTGRSVITDVRSIAAALAAIATA